MIVERGHVRHLLTRYVHGTLRADQRAVVLQHVRVCADCRAALAREEQIAADLRGDLTIVAGPRQGQLASTWSGVWREVSAGRRSAFGEAPALLSGLGMILALLVVFVVALALEAGAGMRVEAALQQAHPISTASPGPEAAETVEAQAGRAAPHAEATLALGVGLTPAPVPQLTVSPEPEASGARWQ